MTSPSCTLFCARCSRSRRPRSPLVASRRLRTARASLVAAGAHHHEPAGACVGAASHRPAAASSLTANSRGGELRAAISPPPTGDRHPNVWQRAALDWLPPPRSLVPTPHSYCPAAACFISSVRRHQKPLGPAIGPSPHRGLAEPYLANSELLLAVLRTSLITPTFPPTSAKSASQLLTSPNSSPNHRLQCRIIVCAAIPSNQDLLLLAPVADSRLQIANLVTTPG